MTRKIPQQERSKKMVELILSVSEDMLRKEGLLKFSTNRIAQKAGISVGSLYQYFPNKEDILSAISANYANNLSKTLIKQIMKMADEPLELLIKKMTLSVMNEVAEDADLLIQVFQFTKLTDNQSTLRIAENLISEASRSLLMKSRGRFPTHNIDLTLYVCLNTVMLTILRYSIDPPAHLNREDIANELAFMIESLLLNPRAKR